MDHVLLSYSKVTGNVCMFMDINALNTDCYLSKLYIKVWFLSHRKQTCCLLQRPVNVVQVKMMVSQSICNVMFTYLFCWQYC